MSAFASPATLLVLVLLIVAVSRKGQPRTGSKVAVLAVLYLAFTAVLVVWGRQFLAHA